MAPVVDSYYIKDRLEEEVSVSEFKSVLIIGNHSFGVKRTLLGRLGYDGRFYVDNGKRRYLYKDAADREITFFNQGNGLENLNLKL